MYSVVMATMLAAGSTTPAWHHHCYSSCYGCSSCYSYPVHRIFHYHHCHSYYGCGCYSGYRGYCSGCTTVVYYSGCNICSGCSICCGGVIVTPAAPRVIEVPPAKTEKISPPKKQPEEGSKPSQQKSRVTVVVPSDARLWVDNVECPLTSAVRSFDTPALQGNQQYVYNLRIEMIRDGRTVVQTRRAIITPGQPVQVDFNAGALVTASR